MILFFLITILNEYLWGIDTANKKKITSQPIRYDNKIWDFIDSVDTCSIFLTPISSNVKQQNAQQEAVMQQKHLIWIEKLIILNMLLLPLFNFNWIRKKQYLEQLYGPVLPHAPISFSYIYKNKVFT